MSGRHTPKHALQALICPLLLTVGLWVVSQEKTHCHPECCSEQSPHLGCELRTPVQNNVTRDSMQTEDVLNKERSHLRC